MPPKNIFCPSFYLSADSGPCRVGFSSCCSLHLTLTVLLTMENDLEVCIHHDRLWIISGFHQQAIKLWMDPVACTRHRGCAFGNMLRSHQWNPELEAKGHCHLNQTIKAVSQPRGCTQVEVFINMWLRTASSKLIQAPKEKGIWNSRYGDETLV